MAKPIYVIDYEVYPNYLVAVVINFQTYWDVCKDLDKYSIYDKKDIVKNVSYHVFIISERRNDLFQLLSFLNTSMFLATFNGNDYDNIISNYLLSNYPNFKTWKDITKNVYDLSKKIINIQKYNIEDESIKILKFLKVNYNSIDVQKVFGLNKIKKSLKQTLVNLNWYSILDYSMPDMTKEEIDFYIFKGYPENTLNLIDEWDRYVFPHHEKHIIEYCFNDVAGTCEIVRIKIDDILLRMNASIKYKVDLLSSSESNMADKIFARMYCEKAKITPQQLKAIKPYERRYINVKECIPNIIRFSEEPLKRLYTYFFNKIITDTKNELKYQLEYANCIFNLGTGGLHTKDTPADFKSDDDFYIIDGDATSFYPFIVYNNKFYPAHLNKDHFLNTTITIVNDRVTAKRRKDMVEAQTLKITINSGVFGKMGYEFSVVYDRRAMVSVTITGQFSLLMWIERLIMIPGITILSVNTDGVVCKVAKKSIFAYYEVCREWEKDTKSKLEFVFYERYIRRDVNSYIAVKVGKKPYTQRIKRKGQMNYRLHLEDLRKGFDAPIIAYAVEKHFMEGIPLMETIKAEPKIEMFLITNKPDNKFSIFYLTIVKGKQVYKEVTKNNRYYVSNKGGVLIKKEFLAKGGTIQSKMLAGHYIKLYNDAFKVNTFDEFDIKYSYYYDRAAMIVNQIKLKINTTVKNKKNYIKNNLGMYNINFDE
jgi:hypothetical protein